MTADASGTQTARQTYFPFGAARTTEGTLPTDYTSTGQKLDASSNLMYYGARYYDASLGRFPQPDSIIPDLYNPQSLNRYSYTLNNPVKYTDPTGHNYCDEHVCQGDDETTVSGEDGSVTSGVYAGEGDENTWSGDALRVGKEGIAQSDRIAMMQKTGKRLIKQGLDDADLLMALAALGARLTGDNTDAFVDDLTLLTWGWHAKEAPHCGFYGPTACAGEVRVVNGAALNWPWRGGTGFLSSYMDPPGLESNQVGHFWEFVAATFHLGPLMGPIASNIGNDWHEIFGSGNSWQDHALSKRGIELGVLLSRPFFPLRPSDVPNWIKYNIAAPK